MNLKYQEQHRMKSSNYLMDLIVYQYQAFRIISNMSSRSMKHWLINNLLKYMSMELRTKLYSRLNLHIIFNF